MLSGLMEGLELGCQDGLALSRGGIESLLLNVPSTVRTFYTGEKDD